MFNLYPEYLLTGIIFGAIGSGALLYGRKTSSWKPAVIGIALIACTFVVSDTLPMILIGCALTAALFIFRD